jgi:hypothetical protein
VVRSLCQGFVLNDHSHLISFGKTPAGGLVWWFTPITSAIQKVEVRGSQFEAGQSKSGRPYLKNKIKQRAGGVAQVGALA